MRKRVSFFIVGNFQLAFLLALAAMLAIWILAAAGLNYASLSGILEGAAFSSHLSLASSGELMWRTVVEVSLLAALLSMVMGCVVIVVVLWRLETLFRSLVEGVGRLARAEYGCRLRMGWRWLGRRLLHDFNDAAADLQQRAGRLSALLEAAAAATEANEQASLEEIKSLQEQLRQIRCP